MPLTDKPTCGPMYKEALAKYGSDNPELIRVFAAGFVSGQAEKVYLGACRAAMFRPSQDRYGMLIETVNDVAARYGLCVVAPIGSKQEIWICRPAFERNVQALQRIEEDTPFWHQHRAILCGVPFGEVDIKFHLRNGHGCRCD